MNDPEDSLFWLKNEHLLPISQITKVCHPDLDHHPEGVQKFRSHDDPAGYATWWECKACGKVLPDYKPPLVFISAAGAKPVDGR